MFAASCKHPIRAYAVYHSATTLHEEQGRIFGKLNTAGLVLIT